MIEFTFAMHGLKVENLEPSLNQIKEYYPDMTWEVVKRGMANMLKISNLETLNYEKSTDFFYDPRRESWYDAGISLKGFPVTTHPHQRQGDDYNSYMGNRSLLTGEKE